MRWRGPIGVGAVVAARVVAGCGSSDSKTVTETRTVVTEKAPAKTSLVGDFELSAPVDAPEEFQSATGTGTVALRGDDYQLVIQADLPRNRPGEAYEVWLYNSRSDARSLGAQVTGRSGRLVAAGKLPDTYLRDYRYVDISRERIDEDTSHSGLSVLRGKPAP